MSIPKMTNDLAVIQKLSDLPNSTEGLTSDQLKAKFDEASLEIQRYINEKLIPAIVAQQIPFTATSEINAQDVDAAIREVQSQVKDASSGTIVNGSVTTEKLSAALLARVYGGRPWVSLNTPGGAQNKETDFPIGQIWLRPAFTVANRAGSNWTANGCTVSAGNNKITLTGNRTVVTATATQALTNIGQDGDRVMVLLGIQNKDSDITRLTVSLNSGEEKDASVGVFSESLVGGALTVQISATWPSTSLADGSVDVVNYAVVNLDQVLRQTVDAEDMTDWAAYLNGLLPLTNYTSPEEVFIQTLNGNWWPIGFAQTPVSRGGTGMSDFSAGEMIYADGSESFAKIERPGRDGALLRFRNGVPAWGWMDELAADGSFLRPATGSYQGTGTSQTVTLSVEPTVLFIYGNDGTFASVAQGTKHAGTCGDSMNTYQAYVHLSGKSVTFSRDYGGTNRVPEHMNKSGVAYKWVAIY